MISDKQDYFARNNDGALDESDERAFKKLIPSTKSLHLYTSDGVSVSLENFYRGSHVFLVCSGPSIKSLDLSLLSRRGIVTMAINNAWSIIRPNLWVCVDDPGNFLDIGWKDPSIIKFAPLGHLHKNLQVKESNGTFRPSQFKVADMPSVYYFRRNEKFEVGNFLCQNTVNWGNRDSDTDDLGNKGGRSVMLAAIRLLYYLGFRRIYLLGADFKMEIGKQNYVFAQDRSSSSVKGNNNTYRALNSRFEAMKPIFEQNDLQIFNCNNQSGLTAFPFIHYQQAIDVASGRFQKEMDTEGWYDRKERERKAKEDAEKREGLKIVNGIDFGEEVEDAEDAET